MPAGAVEAIMMRRLITAAAKYWGLSPGASAFISHGAARIAAAEKAASAQAKQRLSFRKSPTRSSRPQAVSMGTNANTMPLISTEFSVSNGPMATANESARLCVPSR
jgi:hypothetical protein